MDAGALFIVATPIGNLEDITLRAITILSEVDYILCEDTRVTQKLIAFVNSKLQITNSKLSGVKLLSYHQHSSDSRKLEILKLLLDGKNIALVTDAGTPGISDPGNELIAFILEKDPKIKVVPIPGPSAIISALSISGFEVNKFVFLGFMPKKKKSKIFNWLKSGGVSFAYYDSPFRVIKNLTEIEKEFGSETKVFVARELTKIYETTYRGNVSEVIRLLQNDVVKGEVVVVIESN